MGCGDNLNRETFPCISMVWVANLGVVCSFVFRCFLSHMNNDPGKIDVKHVKGLKGPCWRWFWLTRFCVIVLATQGNSLKTKIKSYALSNLYAVLIFTRQINQTRALSMLPIIPLQMGNPMVLLGSWVSLCHHQIANHGIVVSLFAFHLS